MGLGAGPPVRVSTLSNMNISETSRSSIIIKFHLEQHWGGGLTALGFGLDRIRTLVSMATDEGVDREVPNPHFPPPLTPLPSLSPPQPHSPPLVRFFPPPDKIVFLFMNLSVAKNQN